MAQTDTGDDGNPVITALVPTSEILRYAVDLRSITAGRGRFSASHDHYDILPSHLWATVSKPAKAAT